MASARGEVAGFVDFIREKGVIGLAIAVIIGAAVNTVVNSLVSDIINPLVGLVIPAEGLAKATANVAGATVGWGALVSALIKLIIVVLVVYYGVKALRLDRLDKKAEK